MTVHAIVLAAGKGTRMNSDLAKVLHRAAGRSLLGWALAALEGVDDVAVVVGHQAESVIATLPEGVQAVVQEPQNGTGHAAIVGLAGLDIGDGDTVVVMPGDMPLISAGTVDKLLRAHAKTDAAATVVTADAVDPTGYGRIVRDGDHVAGIVEDRDAGPQQAAICEINTSVYAFEGEMLAKALGEIDSDNDQEEQYLTDVVAVLRREGAPVEAMKIDESEALGVNSHSQLATASQELRRRINEGWMDAGVAMVDPDRVYVDAGVTIAPGVSLYPDVHLEGATEIATGASIGPGVFASDSSVGPDTRVSYSVLTGVAVGAGAIVGPYAHLRPGTELGDGSKAGSFVEIKASSLGPGSKVPHLSYLGDASIGEGANVGAGTVTVNYDGYAKHRTVIGDRVRIGSDTMLVAPVEIGDDAYTGAGSVITKDVSPGSLAVERSPQREIPGYAARRRRKADREQS